MDINTFDMNRLRDIMKKFSADPIKDIGYGDPLHRLIFCQVLAEKFPELIENKREGKVFPRTLVKEFLGYHDNSAVKHSLRKEGIESIKTYKDYYHKYKVIRAAYFDDPRYKRMETLEHTRDMAQKEMNELMKEIITEE